MSMCCFNDEAPFLKDLGVGFHQVVWYIVTCQILQDVSSRPLNLKDNIWKTAVDPNELKKNPTTTTEKLLSST